MPSFQEYVREKKMLEKFCSRTTTRTHDVGAIYNMSSHKEIPNEMKIENQEQDKVICKIDSNEVASRILRRGRPKEGRRVSFHESVLEEMNKVPTTSLQPKVQSCNPPIPSLNLKENQRRENKAPLSFKDYAMQRKAVMF